MYHHQDFKVYEYRSTANPSLEQWQVRVGKREVVVTYRDRERAEYVAEQLNRDPWYLDKQHKTARQMGN